MGGRLGVQGNAAPQGEGLGAEILRLWLRMTDERGVMRGVVGAAPYGMSS